MLLFLFLFGLMIWCGLRVDCELEIVYVCGVIYVGVESWIEEVLLMLYELCYFFFLGNFSYFLCSSGMDLFKYWWG